MIERNKKSKLHNESKTCWNCPAANLIGNVDFRACGQARELVSKVGDEEELVIECRRRPQLGFFEPNITFKQCPEWIAMKYGYMLKNMKVMILGVDGYLGWPLALKLANLGFNVSGLDNYTRRDCLMEKGGHTIVPIERMTERLEAVQDVLGKNIYFRRIDLRNEARVREFLEEVKPESVIHYAEIPSAPYSMVDMEHAVQVQENNVMGTLKVLWLMKEIVPESNLIKLGTMGEYGTPLTGRPLFEGLFPADVTIEWKGRKWSLGGETTPRDPASFYHVSKVQDTFNILEACKYWWLRSYDVMQGVIYGLYTEELSMDKRLRTRFDIDEWFGTVINRFVAQASVGIPLTIYGKGEQIRGFIALRDAMQCMVRLIVSPPEPGQ
ncbi:MAG: NAD-dependent epimerase/dehydratase family protein, partial [Promethearchaeia archaeon]